MSVTAILAGFFAGFFGIGGGIITVPCLFYVFGANEIDKSFIKEKNIDLPIQINGKFVTTYQTQIDYEINDIYDNLINISKVNEKIKNKKLVKKINVQNKIINLIFN